MVGYNRPYRKGSEQCQKDINPFIDQGGFWCASKESGSRYTGNVVVGVMPMHKSNTVPVTKVTAIDTTRMRRG